MKAVRSKGMNEQIEIVGGGLAASEAAWQLTRAAVRLRVFEMRDGGDTTAAATRPPRARRMRWAKWCFERFP